MHARPTVPVPPPVQVLLQSGADPTLTDHSGLSALDYSRRKLMRLQAKPRRKPKKSLSLDENNQLQLSAEEQAELDKRRGELAGDARESIRNYWQARLRAARRVFNDPEQVEQIVSLLEAATSG